MATSLPAASLIEVFLLLLIGVGPKIALVPYLEATSGISGREKRQVAAKMIRTAATVSLVLLFFGEILSQLLHFSQAALSIAGGIILLIVAVTMVLGQPATQHDKRSVSDPMELAVFPLAIPYLLNPAGIVALVLLSSEATNINLLLGVILVLAVVIIIDSVVFRWANIISEHLDAGRLLVTEKVFGFLLAALAVQLAIDGIMAAVPSIH